MPGKRSCQKQGLAYKTPASAISRFHFTWRSPAWATARHDQIESRSSAYTEDDPVFAARASLIEQARYMKPELSSSSSSARLHAASPKHRSGSSSIFQLIELDSWSQMCCQEKPTRQGLALSTRRTWISECISAPCR